MKWFKDEVFELLICTDFGEARAGFLCSWLDFLTIFSVNWMYNALFKIMIYYLQSKEKTWCEISCQTLIGNFLSSIDCLLFIRHYNNFQSVFWLKISNQYLTENFPSIFCSWLQKLYIIIVDWKFSSQLTGFHSWQSKMMWQRKPAKAVLAIPSACMMRNFFGSFQ